MAQLEYKEKEGYTMKRIASILLSLCMLLTITACSSGSSVSQEDYDKLKAQVDSLQAENDALKGTMAPAETETTEKATELEETTEPTEATDKVGTRKNPAKVGDTITVEIDSYAGTGTLEITLSEVVSGDEAWTMIVNENQFNDAPGEGNEYILAKFDVTFVTDKSSDDTPLEVRERNFKYSTTDYSIQDLPSLVTPDGLDLTLYEGASGSGWVALVAKEGESSPYAVYAETVWFALR